MIALILNNTTITGYGLKVSCELPLPEEDLSGQSSSTATAEKGFKPKRLKVSLNIKYEDADVLSTILLLSSATDSGTGKRTVYNIDNQTASAFGVRQVRFTDRVSAQEMDGSHAWSVSFTLLEHLSTSEKIESQRLAQSDTKLAAADQAAAEEAQGNRSWLDKLIDKLDSALSNENGS
ncbi:DNA-binding protein [Marinomonas sp. THO17]|uniref:baseplate complex protein n=1 Tax=Marinomonas sp. THO17 TaxID=3149048 RepID=UPI00336BB187